MKILFFTYGNKIIYPLYSINHSIKNKKHYVLLNQVRTISKGRVLRPFIYNEEEIVLNEKAINKLRSKYVNFINYHMMKKKPTNNT